MHSSGLKAVSSVPMPFQVASRVRSAALRSSVLSLAKTGLDGFQVWTVRRQEQKPGACLAQGLAYCRAFMASEIVHDDDVAGRQCRHETLLEVRGKACAVDRPLQHKRGVDAV